MEYLRRKNKTKEKENPLLSALKTKCLKAERREVGRDKIPTPPKNSRGIDGGVGKMFCRINYNEYPK